MSPIKYAVDRIMKLGIPSLVLDLAFKRKADTFRINNSLEKQITEMVIEDIVLVDANLIGGMTVRIPVSSCTVEQYEYASNVTNYVIKVPFTATGNKKIIQTMSLVVNLDTNIALNTSNNSLQNAGINKLNYDSHRSNADVYTNLELIATNTILVHENVNSILNGYIEVTVENNKNLSNIKPANHIAFAEMCMLATKAFIYNKLEIELETGSLYYGHDISKVGSKVDEYANAYEDYNTYLREKWQKISFMNDNTAMKDFLKMSVSP